MPDKKRPTIKTIAEIAGLSHVAVSKALRDAPDISAETKARVRLIADETGYIANAYARSLSTKATNMIGMIVPAVGENVMYSAVFNEMSALAAKKGVSLLLGCTGRSIELEKQYCQNMCENRIGALIVSPSTSEVSHFIGICKDTVPIIFLGGKTGLEQRHCLTMDYYDSGVTAVNYLNRLGHRRIALFLYHPDNNTIRQKLNGYRETMEKLDLKPEVYWEGDSSDTYHAGETLVNRLIRQDSLPSAIWCASDLMALGVMEALRKNKIRVPEQVSVLGHDDLFISAIDSISLSTFSTPAGAIGRKLLEMAEALMKDDGQADTGGMQEVFRSTLTIRQSTGPYIAPSVPGDRSEQDK